MPPRLAWRSRTEHTAKGPEGLELGRKIQILGMLGSQGTHRDNAHFDRARWRKRIILPCWAIQMAALASLLGLFSYRLSHTVTTWKEEDQKGNVPVIEFV